MSDETVDLNAKQNSAGMPGANREKYSLWQAVEAIIDFNSIEMPRVKSSQSF
jgi:hypothetical protein